MMIHKPLSCIFVVMKLECLTCQRLTLRQCDFYATHVTEHHANPRHFPDEANKQRSWCITVAKAISD